jgi:hypothetical protein
MARGLDNRESPPTAILGLIAVRIIANYRTPTWLMVHQTASRKDCQLGYSTAHVEGAMVLRLVSSLRLRPLCVSRGFVAVDECILGKNKIVKNGC